MSRRAINVTFGLLLLVVVCGGAIFAHVAGWALLYSSTNRGMSAGDSYWVGNDLVPKAEREAEIAIKSFFWAFFISVPTAAGLFAAWGVAFTATRLIATGDPAMPPPIP